MYYLPLSCAECLEIWKPQPPATLWALLGLYRDCFTFMVVYYNCKYTAKLDQIFLNIRNNDNDNDVLRTVMHFPH